MKPETEKDEKLFLYIYVHTHVFTKQVMCSAVADYLQISQCPAGPQVEAVSFGQARFSQLCRTFCLMVWNIHLAILVPSQLFCWAL